MEKMLAVTVVKYPPILFKEKQDIMWERFNKTVLISKILQFELHRKCARLSLFTSQVRSLCSCYVNEMIYLFFWQTYKELGHNNCNNKLFLTVTAKYQHFFMNLSSFHCTNVHELNEFWEIRRKTYEITAFCNQRMKSTAPRDRYCSSCKDWK